MAINILTCNINGLNDQTKRDNFFGFLKKSSFDLILLQETKSGPSTVKRWSDEWTGESIWNSGPSHSCCGVAVLSKSNISLNELNRDSHGRILNVMMKIDEHEMQVLNIYAPNVPRERRNFFCGLVEFSQDTGLPVLLAGDFNMVESLPLDTEGSNNAKYHTYGIDELGVFQNKYNLVDVFRFKFPAKREFTWRNQTVKCRLDRIYCPDKIAEKITFIKILPNPFSDHEFMAATVNFSKTKRGPGYWKLNCSLLEIEAHRQKIELLIQDWQTKKRSYKSISKWWDDCKLFVRAELQHISMQESAKNKKQIKRIENEIQRERQNANPNLDSIKEKRDALFQLQLPGVFIRTKQKLIEEGEKPSKFLYNLEKSQQRNKSITKIRTNDGTLTSEPGEILNSLASYYQNVYTKTNLCEDSQNYVLSHITKHLRDDENQFLNARLTSAELKEALFKFENGKSPGYDGFPAEFYKTFWHILEKDFEELAYEILFVEKKTSHSMKKSIISLIPKQGDLTDRKNWRPISLIGADYKIITKALALRLAKVMGKIIEPNQTCGIPGRNIFSNLHLVRDLIDYAEFKNLPSFILSIDQEKAFDKVDRAFLLKILHKFNLGENFISFIQTLYSDVSASVLNSGFMSIFFPTERGVRQGDPLSLLLYVFVAEALALVIRADSRIEGFPLPGTPKPLKIQQYADDSNFFARDVKSVRYFFEKVNIFEKASGSVINASKTRGLALGGFDPKNYSELDNIEWTNNTGFKILGVTFYTRLSRTTNFNWLVTLNKIEKQLKFLGLRILSLRGKTTLINTLAMSKVWFLANVLPIPEWVIERLHRAIFENLWQKTNYNPVKRETLFLPVKSGGLGILSPKEQSLALRLKTLFQLKECEEEKTHDFYYFSKYWLASSLVKFTKQNESWNFLRLNNFPKHWDNKMSQYYKTTVEILKNNGPLFYIPLKTTKNIYLEVAKNKKTVVPAERFWNSSFKTTMPWAQIWKKNFTSHACGPAQNILFRFLHNSLPSAVLLAKSTRQQIVQNNKCKTCGKI